MLEKMYVGLSSVATAATSLGFWDWGLARLRRRQVSSPPASSAPVVAPQQSKFQESRRTDGGGAL